MKALPKITETQRKFIELAAKGVNYREAYSQAFDKQHTTAKTRGEQGSKYAKRFEVEIQQAREKDKQAVEEARKSEVVKEALKAILTQAEVDAKVSSIIKGELETENVFVTKDGIVKVKTKPSHTDILRAVDIYNKRFGSNAAQVMELTTAGDTTIKWGDKEIKV